MRRIGESINVKNGTTINELEAFMILAEKLLEAKIEENPKSGIIIAKGQDNEVKVRYKEALTTLNRLYGYFGLKGCYSFGICATCSSFNSDGYSTRKLGKCKGREMNWCDTCNEHSDSGGGFGK